MHNLLRRMRTRVAAVYDAATRTRARKRAAILALVAIVVGVNSIALVGCASGGRETPTERYEWEAIAYDAAVGVALTWLDESDATPDTRRKVAEAIAIADAALVAVGEAIEAGADSDELHDRFARFRAALRAIGEVRRELEGEGEPTDDDGPGA